MKHSNISQVNKMRKRSFIKILFTFFPFSPFLLFLMLLEDMITTLGTESEMTENWLVITITVPGTKGHATANVVSHAADTD